MLILVGLLLITVLTAATGYFVAQEFGYVAVDRGKLKQLADGGDRAAARALEVTGRLSFMLSGAQLGITVTALLVGYVAEPFLGAGLADLLGLTGISSTVALPLSVALALIIATVVQMVLGELAPKNLAIARAEPLARALSRSTLIYLKIAGPLITLFDRAAVRLLRRIGIEPIEELPSGATPQDLEQIIAESREEGHLDAEMSDLLDRGLDFRGLTAGEAMVPRVDVHTVRADEPVSRIVELLDTGHSRFPVSGAEGVDDLIGVVGIADVLGVPPAQRATTRVDAVAVPPLLVPETLPLPTVLDRLRSGHRQLACVVDEYGGFAGVITLEDLAEELVGPIRDEDDPPDRAAARQEDGSWVVPARWRIDEVADSTGIELPEAPEYDTLSGLVMRELGRVPEVGDLLEIPVATDGDGPASGPRVLVEVLAVDRHVADSVRLRPTADVSGEGAA
ncbi:HlyC/CorC family transporter [Micromonospora tulbaghiae]|uniref:Hemolysin, contains CBS domains n=1 Tax=Micromonospora tulbaghiae TaxID=479978 RepID=A0AAW4JNW6_9ACTN|nr:MULTISPECIES: hemolysin family protein [Micromonospora]KAB1901848.1 HlyC/CorC family transporter [Micromonospora sp. AMSO1212t]MBO4143723.1 HlyC/CorC family transporter [Micromonospora tulbaghiae]MDX5458005.1 hemolysin family protein [Micromonospora tulbaghiae]SCE84501.1 Hemolysin, contains CBS domains [Micromonospora tulbaghiae]